MNIEQILADAGYREITLRSYTELIGGCRYVCIETLGSEGFKMLQFLPRLESKPTWDVCRWEDWNALYICTSLRSQLDAQAKIGVGYVWYGKVSEKVNLVEDYFVGSPRQNRGNFFATAEWFVAHEPPSSRQTPYDVTFAFARAHPLNPRDRAIVDLERIQAELAAREAALRQKEYFLQVDELRGISAQFMANGDMRAGAFYQRQADELKRRIQSKLDAGETIIARETIPEPTWLSSAQPPGWRDDADAYIPRTNKSAPSETLLDPIGKKKRVISFED